MKKKGFDLDSFVENIYETLYPNSYKGPFVTVPELGATLDEIELRPWRTKAAPHHIELSTQIGNAKLNFPAFSAPMDTVTNGLLSKELSEVGGCGVIFRHRNPEVQLGWIAEALSSTNCLVEKPKYVLFGDKVERAQEVLSSHAFSTIPVLTKGGKLSGMIFTGGIAFEGDRLEEPVKEWMVPFNDLKVEYKNTSFSEIKKRLLTEKNCNVLPLIDEKRKFHGLYFMKDVLVESQSTFNGKPLVGMAVSAATSDIDQRLAPALKMGIGVVVIDSSHGNCDDVLDQTTRVMKTVTDYSNSEDVPRPAVISGNVADVDGYVRLSLLGVDGVKFGIGSGSICITSNVTGVGVPLFTLIREAKYTKLQLEEKNMHAPAIIADGGIPGPGSSVVALGAGADAVMGGKWFVAFTESISAQNHITPDGMVYYRGMASPEAIKERSSSRYEYKGSKKRAAEGEEGKVLHRGPTKKCIRYDRENIQSGFSHVGAENIKQLHEYGINHRRAFYRFSGAGMTQLETHIDKSK